jgi:hypothetical protein
VPNIPFLQELRTQGKGFPWGVVHSSFALVALCGLLASVGGCGTADPEEFDPLADPSRNGLVPVGEAGENAPGSKKSVAFTVPAAPSAADVVFLVDDDGAHRHNGTVRSRLDLALEGFVARLRFTRGDLKVLLGPSSIPDTDQNGLPIKATEMDKGYGFWREANGTLEALAYNTPKVDEILSKRIFDRNDESYQYSPLSSLRRVATLANGKGLRGESKKSFTHFVLLASRPDSGETSTPEDVIETLDEELKAGWHLTVIGLPKDGCDVGDQNRTLIGSPKKTDGTPSGHEYKPAALAKAAGERGTFLSICEKSFAAPLQAIAASPAGRSGAKVELGAKAIAKSIEVTSPKGLVTGWKYVSGESKLVLPSHLLPGTKLTITFLVHDGKAPNPLPVEMAAPAVLDKQLSPEEILFVQKAAPILQRNCAGGGCHSAGAPRVFVGNYANVRSSKDSIKDRVSRMSGASGFMPLGKTMTPADLTALVAYLDGLK